MDETTNSIEPLSHFPKYQGAQNTVFSALTGKYAAIVDDFACHLVDMESGKECLQIVREGVSSIEFSPLESFFITCEKFNGSKNLFVWNCENSKEISCYEWKR